MVFDVSSCSCQVSGSVSAQVEVLFWCPCEGKTLLRASLTKEGSKSSFSGHWRPNRSSFAKLFPLSTEKGIMGRLGINTPAERLKLCQMNIIIKNLQKCDTET